MDGTLPPGSRYRSGTVRWPGPWLFDQQVAVVGVRDRALAGFGRPGEGNGEFLNPLGRHTKAGRAAIEP